MSNDLSPLSGPVDASGEPAPFDTDKAVAELKAAGWVSDGYGTRWTAPDGVIWRGPAGAWRVMCRQRDEALCRDGSTPEHPRLDGSYGWPKTPRGEAEALTDDFRRKWPNVQGIDRESLVGWFQTAMCIGAQSAAAAVPSSPAQEQEEAESRIPTHFSGNTPKQAAISEEQPQWITLPTESNGNVLVNVAALPPSSPVADPSTRSFWVMERSALDGDWNGAPMYWDGGHAESSTRDIHKAVQWCRKADLLNCLKFTKHYAQWGWTPVEHGIMAPARQIREIPPPRFTADLDEETK